MEELVAIGAIVEAIQKVYSWYQQIYNFLAGPGPNVDDEILSALAQMSTQLTAIQNAITTLNTAVSAGIAAQEVKAIDDIAAAVAVQVAAADTAAEEFAQWVQGGRRDTALIEDAKNGSEDAADTMREAVTYFELPVANQAKGTAQNVFDYRLALVQYIYVLTVRLTVIMGTETDWSADPVIGAELGKHGDYLAGIVARMSAAIRPVPGSAVTVYPATASGPATFGVWTQTVDTIGGYATAVYASDLAEGSQADGDAALALVQTHHFAEVRNAIGLTAVMQLQAMLSWYADGAPAGGTWLPWTALAPSIGADDSQPQTTPAPGDRFPLTATSDDPYAVSLFWVAVDGSVRANVSPQPTRWQGPSTIIAAGAAGFDTGIIENLGSTVVQAVSSDPGSISLLWTTPDGSIQGSCYDARATNPAWAAPFYLVQAEGGWAPWASANRLLATVSTGPGVIRAFWAQSDSTKVLSSSFALTVESAGGQTVVVASAPTAAQTVATDWDQREFAAVSTGAGSVSAFWFSARGLQSSYYDERASVASWATPFLLGPASPMWLNGLTALSTAPYSAEVFWAPAAGAEQVPIMACSYTLLERQSPMPDGILISSVVHTAPTPAAQIVPPGYLAGGGPDSDGLTSAGIAAAASAPIGHLHQSGGPRPGAACVFWLTNDRCVQSSYRPAAGSAWTTPAVLGAPIGESFSPIVCVASATGDISVFAHAPDGTILGSRYQQVALRPAPRPLPIR